jgi:hypothetical protein
MSNKTTIHEWPFLQSKDLKSQEHAYVIIQCQSRYGEPLGQSRVNVKFQCQNHFKFHSGWTDDKGRIIFPIDPVNFNQINPISFMRFDIEGRWQKPHLHFIGEKQLELELDSRHFMVISISLVLSPK